MTKSRKSGARTGFQSPDFLRGAAIAGAADLRPGRHGGTPAEAAERPDALSATESRMMRPRCSGSSTPGFSRRSCRTARTCSTHPSSSTGRRRSPCSSSSSTARSSSSVRTFPPPTRSGAITTTRWAFFPNTKRDGAQRRQGRTCPSTRVRAVKHRGADQPDRPQRHGRRERGERRLRLREPHGREVRERRPPTAVEPCSPGTTTATPTSSCSATTDAGGPAELGARRADQLRRRTAHAELQVGCRGRPRAAEVLPWRGDRGHRHRAHRARRLLGHPHSRRPSGDADREPDDDRHPQAPMS